MYHKYIFHCKLFAYHHKQLQLRWTKPGAINENWSIDFVSDALFDGRRMRALTVVDGYRRESLAIEVGQSITGGRL